MKPGLPPLPSAPRRHHHHRTTASPYSLTTLAGLSVVRTSAPTLACPSNTITSPGCAAGTSVDTISPNLELMWMGPPHVGGRSVDGRWCSCWC